MSKSVNELQHCLDRLLEGDESARADLLDATCDRLRRLTRKMVRDFPSVRRWEETDDVFQNSMLRLCRALETLTPHNVTEFIGLAALQIRRELLDLARHYYGRNGIGANHGSGALFDDSEMGSMHPQESTLEPQRLAMWYEFHLQVEALPQDERQLFDLLWYQGLPQLEVANLLGVTERTIQRQWQNVRLRVHREMKRSLPGV